MSLSTQKPTEPATAPYGTWSSSIAATDVAAGGIRYSEARWHKGDLFWLESRPAEKGRTTVVMRNTSGETRDLLPPPWNARSKVHEYGGGAYTLWQGMLYFVEASDQQIYALTPGEGTPVAITDHPTLRFADLTIDAHRHRLLAVGEDHHSAEVEPENLLVAIALPRHSNRLGKGSSLNGPSPNSQSNAVTRLAAGHDFYANPTVSPCGQHLVYLCWDHPNMPWDSNQLRLCHFNDSGRLHGHRLLAGGANESIAQPRWAPNGDLFWVSDRTDWWNLYRLPANALATQSGQAHAICPMAAEFTGPQWQFGQSCYDFIADHRIFAAYNERGHWRCALIDADDSNPAAPWSLTSVESPFCTIASVQAHGQQVVLLGASATRANGVHLWHSDQGFTQVNQTSPLRCHEGDIAPAQSLAIPTAQGPLQAYFYAPTNHRYRAPETERPPCIALCHGGPTGATDAALSLKIQFWTSRGFAVLDVNYRGSTGFGRHYRQALQGQWGVADVADLIAATEYVCQQGWVDAQKCIVRGSSAGGFSVLTALTDSRVFSAGVSLYGVGDLERLVADTHKFEARYLDGLIGPYPQEQALYETRSPIHKVDRIACPVLVYQGLEDKVVPPSQAETLVAAVKRQGLPVAYVTYPDEAHGFRQADNICHQLESELAFYREIFHIESNQPPGEPLPEITLHNADAL